MTITKDVKLLEAKMRPGRLSKHGFLGPSENLDSILADDKVLLDQLSVTHSELASNIETIISIVMGQRQKDLKEWLKRQTRFPKLAEPNGIPQFNIHNLPNSNQGFLVGKLHVFIMQWRGFQECPWGCVVHTDWASIDFMILNRESGEFFTGPGLAVHLIREHHFFEGKETPFRVDPEKAIRVLEIPTSE